MGKCILSLVFRVISQICCSSTSSSTVFSINWGVDNNKWKCHAKWRAAMSFEPNKNRKSEWPDNREWHSLYNLCYILQFTDVLFASSDAAQLIWSWCQPGRELAFPRSHQIFQPIEPSWSPVTIQWDIRVQSSWIGGYNTDPIQYNTLQWDISLNPKLNLTLIPVKSLPPWVL